MNSAVDMSFQNSWGAKRQMGLAKGKWGAERQMWRHKGKWGAMTANVVP
jgi:hypothetical protein